MSFPKEIHYYDNLSNLTRQEYLSNFKTDKKIVGTTPQSYTKAHHKDFRHIPEKIYKETPDVKLIYIVRDPFERLLSHVLENRYGDTIKRAKYNASVGHYWKTSLYYYQLSLYLKYFSKEQIHVLTLEELKKNKLQTLNKVFRFLEVREMQDETLFDYVKNDAKSKGIPHFIKIKLWYRLLNKVQSNIAKEIALNLIDRKYKDFLVKPILGSLINEDIVDQIKNDSLKLGKEFSLDVSFWNLNPELNEHCEGLT